MNRISSDTIFTATGDRDSTGVIGINRKGQVLFVSADENNLVPYVMNSHGNEMALKLASRAGLLRRRQPLPATVRASHVPEQLHGGRQDCRQLAPRLLAHPADH